MSDKQIDRERVWKKERKIDRKKERKNARQTDALVNHFVYREKERQAQKHRWIIRDKIMCLQFD